MSHFNTACLLATLTLLLIPPRMAKAQRCWVQWQLDTPDVRCQGSSQDIYRSPGYLPGRRIVFDNQCPHPVRLAVKIQDTSDNWVTLGWWVVRDNENLVLSAKAQNIDIRTRKANFYLYAETVDGSNHRWFGNHLSTFGNRTLKMKEQIFSVDADGDFTHTLRCSIRR